MVIWLDMTGTLTERLGKCIEGSVSSWLVSVCCEQNSTPPPPLPSSFRKTSSHPLGFDNLQTFGALNKESLSM